MSDCVAACLVTVPSTSFDFGGCGLLDAIRSGFIKNFIALRCDETIPDVTDDTAIAAQVAAGTLFTSPVLSDAEIPFPTTGDEIIENCQPAQPTSKTYAFNFKSYRVDTTGFTDFANWELVSSSLTTWQFGFVTCDNVLIVPQEFATDGALFDVRGTIANPLPNQNAMYYEGQLVFKYSKVLNGVPLTTAVISALGLSGVSIT